MSNTSDAAPGKGRVETKSTLDAKNKHLKANIKRRLGLHLLKHPFRHTDNDGVASTKEPTIASRPETSLKADTIARRRAMSYENFSCTVGKATAKNTLKHSRIRKQRQQKRLLSIKSSGVHVGWREPRRQSQSRYTEMIDSSIRLSTSKHHEDKGLPAKATVDYHDAAAARNARVLQRIIASGTSIELEQLKAQRAAKAVNDANYSSDKVQHYSVVAPRKVNELKEALLNADLANGIIGELRAMEIDEDVAFGAIDAVMAGDTSAIGDQGQESKAKGKLQAIAEADERGVQASKSDSPASTKRKVKAKPVRVVCLDCADGEEDDTCKQADSSPPRRARVQTLYARGKEEGNNVSLPGTQAEPEKTDTEKSSDVASLGVMNSVAASAGDAIGAIGRYFGYKGQNAQLFVTSKEDKTGASARSAPPTTAVGEAVEYTKELVRDIKDHNAKEGLLDTARLAAAGLQVVQPVAGAVTKVVEDQVLPKNQVPEPRKDKPGKQISTMVTTESVSAQKSNSGTSATGQASTAMVKHLDADANAREQAKTSSSKGFQLDGATMTNFVQSPTRTVAVQAADSAGVFDALASATAAAVQQAQGGAEAMQEITPPSDRMAIFIHWWGFELTIPKRSMKNLSTARSVSTALLTFLYAVASSSGAPELLPFVRYISTFMDMEFNAVKSQDKGTGVVVAATWLMPLALVPRTWDYGFQEEPSKKVEKPGPTEKPVEENGQESLTSDNIQGSLSEKAEKDNSARKSRAQDGPSQPQGSSRTTGNL